MRKDIFCAAILASLFTACNSTDKKTETQPVNADSVQSDSKSNEIT